MADISLWVSPEWPEARVQEVLRLREAGLSCGKIAKAMGAGTTRNMVLCKLARMGARSQSGEVNGASTASRKRRVKDVVERRVDARRNGMGYVGEVRPPTPALVLVPPADSKPLLLLDLGHNCRYPVGGEGVETLYCGRDGYPYCAEHYALCHRPTDSAKALARSVRRYV